MAHVTRVNILQEPSRAVQNISQLLEKFFEKAEQENYPNAAFARRTARSRQVPHIALKQRRRVPRVRKPKAERQDGMHGDTKHAQSQPLRTYMLFVVEKWLGHQDSWPRYARPDPSG